MKILDITDLQYDFVMPAGSMYVDGSKAEQIIDKAHDFISAVNIGLFDFALIKMDTHTVPYEGKSPAHCLYGTKGWELPFDLVRAGFYEKMPVFFMLKDDNDMWKNVPHDRSKRRYYKIRPIVGNQDEEIERDDFMQSILNRGPVDVFCMGGAANYCLHDTMLGYLKRGCRVHVLEDLIYGIRTCSLRQDRASSGLIHDVLALDDFQPYVDAGMISVVRSSEVTRDSGFKPTNYKY